MKGVPTPGKFILIVWTSHPSQFHGAEAVESTVVFRCRTEQDEIRSEALTRTNMELIVLISWQKEFENLEYYKTEKD